MSPLSTNDAPADIPSVGSSEFLEMYMDPRTPYTHICGCANPECDHYQVLSSLKWQSDRPHEIKCKYCGTWFPSDRYPEDNSYELEGKQYFYHEDPDGGIHCFSGAARYHSLNYALGRARVSARDFEESGSMEEAERAKAVLLRMAEIYPGFFYARTPTFSAELPLVKEVPGDMGMGKMKQYFGDYGLPSVFLGIYGPIAESGVFSDEERLKVRALLEDSVGECVLPYFSLYRMRGNTAGQMLTDFARAGRTFPDMRVHDRVHEYFTGEERILSGADLVHEVIEGDYGIENLVYNGFYSDGFFREGSMSYQLMVTSGFLPVLEELQGYSDPAGYRPLDGTWSPVRDLDVKANDQLMKVLLSLSKLAFPNGEIFTLGDTHKDRDLEEVWFPQIAKFSPGGSIIVPAESSVQDGVGVAALRCGTGDDSTAAYLTYGIRGGGHSHYDQLSLTLYSLGRELVTDLGYPDTRDKFRHTWFDRTAGHNTVVVDGKNQEVSMGSLEAFASTKEVQIVQARSETAYPELEDYRRTLVLIGDRDDDSSPRYLVDVFHVIGGATHDYAFHAQSEPEMAQAEFRAEGVTLEGLDNQQATLLEYTPGAEPGTMGYDTVDRLRRGHAARTWSGEWRIGDASDTRLRLTRIPETEEEVWVGQAHGHRMDIRHNPLDTGKMMTWLCSRRTGQSPLRSTFLSVVEAYRGNRPKVMSIRRIPIDAPRDSMAVALEVGHASGSDIIMVSRIPVRLDIKGREHPVHGQISVLRFNAEGVLFGSVTVDAPDSEGEECVETRIAALPEGITQDNLVVEVEDAPSDWTGRTAFLYHDNGTQSAFRIVSSEGRRLCLDRPAYEGKGRIDALSSRSTPAGMWLRDPNTGVCFIKKPMGSESGFLGDGRSLYANTGFHSFASDALKKLFYEGAWLISGQTSVPIEEVIVHGRHERHQFEVRLGEPLADAAADGREFFVSRVGVGDRVRIQVVRATPGM